jgi:8-amino-7-oxononanoate synthase
MMMPTSFESFLNIHATHIREAHQWRELHETRQQGVMVTQQGQDYLSFCSNDYLGLAADMASLPDMAVCGAGASRAVTGNHPAYAKAEMAIAQMKRTEAALMFGSGYLANIGCITALMARGDLILLDRLSHACMIDGALLSGARVIRFLHNNMEHLHALLKQHRRAYRHCLILTETVFSMDGDRAPLSEIRLLANAYDAWMMTDDAHGFGLPEPTPNLADIQMGTCSKAVGTYGGYVAGSTTLKAHLINHARSWLFSTALPEAVCLATYHALQLMQQQPERAERVMRYATDVTQALGMPTAQSAIIPIILGSNEAVLHAQAVLKKQGILVSAIRPPTVAKGTARLRISLSAAHTERHIEQLIDGLRDVLA